MIEKRQWKEKEGKHTLSHTRTLKEIKKCFCRKKMFMFSLKMIFPFPLHMLLLLLGISKRASKIK